MREPKSAAAAARFFLRIGQVGRAAEERDPHTGYLFPLWLLMDCEGMLAPGARSLVEGEQ